MAGAMSVQTDDGIEIYCLPDYARCDISEKSPLDMDECPGLYFEQGCECHPDVCPHYKED